MTGIAIVTSVWGSYSQFLPRWTESIIRQRMQPTQVAILDAGVQERDRVDQAVDRFTEAGFDVRTAQVPFTTLGDARNAAVALTDTEWVIHVDVDDELLPYAVGDVYAVHDRYDVVSLGAIQKGRPRVFPNITAEKILARTHGMFSCGAFRREFWAQRPWHTRNPYVDSTFWVGLAHLGAKFTSTGRVGFVYHQHPDSVSHSLTPQQKQLARKQWHDACREWTLN